MAPNRELIQEQGVIFEDIQRVVKKKMRPTQARETRISYETSMLADQRTSLKIRYLVDQRELMTATRRFQKALQENR